MKAAGAGRVNAPAGLDTPTLQRRIGMSASDSTNGQLEPGAGYWRMSSAPQEKSIPQQRAEMLPRCQLERVELVREFEDKAKSGGGMSKRDRFLELVRFCEARKQEGAPLSVVVCYDTSRFSRADSNETSAYIWRLRQAGVNRLLTWERWYDFRKEEDRAIFNIQQDFTSNRYLRDLSARILRGKKDVAAAGFFTGGAVPYGFDRVLLDERGGEVARFKRGEKVRLRKQGWREVLAPIPEGDCDPARQLERQTVLWLWETFARQTVSYRRLAEELNGRKVPGPASAYGKGKGKWTVRAVAGILSNPVYRGTLRLGAVGKGQYHRLVGGNVTAVDLGAGKTANADGLILAPMERGGYVGPELWGVVREKAKERARLGIKPRASGYTLPGGILYCGHCGHRMYGCTARPKRGAKVYEYRKYTCSAPNVKPGVCKAYSVDEDTIVKVLVERLEKVYLAPERLEGIEAALLAKAEARHEGAPAEAERLRGRLEKLGQDVVRSRRRVLQAEDDVTFAELNEGLREMVEQRDRLTKELAAAEARQGAPVEQDTEKVRAAIARLRDLGQQLRKARGPKLGEVLRLLVSRADLYFEEKVNGGRRWYSFVKGVVKVRPVLDVQGFARSGR
jgi:DNA invertase Pin-like site-specific DNA recombinase